MMESSESGLQQRSAVRGQVVSFRASHSLYCTLYWAMRCFWLSTTTAVDEYLLFMQLFSCCC